MYYCRSVEYLIRYLEVTKAKPALFRGGIKMFLKPSHSGFKNIFRAEGMGGEIWNLFEYIVTNQQK